MREADFVAISQVRDLERELYFLRERCTTLNEKARDLEDRHGLLWARTQVALTTLEQALQTNNIDETKNLATLALNTLLGGGRCSTTTGESDFHG